VTSSARGPAARGTVVRLIVSSATMLFLELMLIRWLGANIVHLSYFSNFVLLGSFLGIGLGFLLAHRTASSLPLSAVALGLLVAVVHAAPVQLDQSGSQLIFFTSLRPSGPPVWLALPVVFLAAALIMIGPGQAVGRCFTALEPLTAYRWDLCGSLLGIASFTLLAYLHAPPLAWACVVFVAYAWLLAPRPPVPAAVALVVVVVVLGIESFAPGTRWSPYYKVTSEASVVAGHRGELISVNGVPHQLLMAARDKLALEASYGLPYKRLPRRPLKDVLIVGAGTGSDVAIALTMGAKHVDAVDIDPVILDIGRHANPDHAYQDPRVTTHVDDGRAFLQRTHKRYDLILFALPDSLVLVNGASSVRLESYLFTVEAVRAARGHLAAHGGFAMYNFYRQPWLVGRLAATLATVFGHAPCVDRDAQAKNLAVIAAATSSADQSCGMNPPPSGLAAGPVHDERPFLYFRGSTLPEPFVVTLALILIASLIAVRALGGQLRAMRPHGDLFFMGAAFLLLETRNVATFALLFGTTWIVNSIVFAGVLTAVLLAVEVTRRWRPTDVRPLYAGTLASLAVAWAVPNAFVLGLPLAARLVVAVALGFAPVLLANITFATRFAQVDNSTEAFGVNVLGAMVGGCLEYAALLTGYRALLVVIAMLYLGAFALTPARTAAPARAG
jgi:SAM-dependent methyltransferase